MLSLKHKFDRLIVLLYRGL